jgi:predicted  nucleic acid-binding Zn-ribbon protein
LPDIDKFKKETEEETTWNYEVGSAVAENEKIKQEEYVKHWDERENWFNSQQEYYEKELAWHKNRIEELEKNSEKLNDQISKFRKSIFGKMYFKLKHDENRD